jgi:hypothetical protein
MLKLTTDLIRPGETPESAIRRLERRPDYARVMGTEEGQQLLRDVCLRATKARREVVTE